MKHDETIDGVIRAVAKLEQALIRAQSGEEFAGRPRKISSRRLQRLSERQNHRCCYCGGETNDVVPPVVEYVVPAHLGGPDHEINLVMRCDRCPSRDRDDLRTWADLARAAVPEYVRGQAILNFKRPPRIPYLPPRGIDA